MNNLLLCSSGQTTNIWSVGTTITAARQIPIGINSSRAIDWNQNNNYIFICSDNGSMYLQSVTKDTCITSLNRVGEEVPVPISCGIILTGSRYALTGDIHGNIRLWPVSKSGFENPTMNIVVDNCQINSFIEYSTSLVYAGTSNGSIIEIDLRKNSCSTIFSLENDSIISMVNANGTIFFSTASSQICRFLPLIKKCSPVYACDPNTVVYLSYSMSSLIDAILIYSSTELIVFSVKTHQAIGTFHSAANIQSADISNDIIVLATDANQLLLLNVYEMIEPIAYCEVNEVITAIRFNHATKSSRPLDSNKQIVFTPSVSPTKNRYSVASPSSQAESHDSILEAARNQIHQNLEKQSSIIENEISSSTQFSEDVVRQAVREVVYPMMVEMQTYVHREISDLKADMVRQFSEQEMVIQRQQDQIEQLVHLLQQRR